MLKKGKDSGQASLPPSFWSCHGTAAPLARLGQRRREQGFGDGHTVGPPKSSVTRISQLAVNRGSTQKKSRDITRVDSALFDGSQVQS